MLYGGLPLRFSEVRDKIQSKAEELRRKSEKCTLKDGTAGTHVVAE